MMLKMNHGVSLADKLAAELTEAEREPFKRGFIQGWIHRGRADHEKTRHNKKMALVKK